MKCGGANIDFPNKYIRLKLEDKAILKNINQIKHPFPLYSPFALSHFHIFPHPCTKKKRKKNYPKNFTIYQTFFLYS